MLNLNQDVNRKSKLKLLFTSLAILLVFFFLTFISLEVIRISGMVSNIKISNEKLDYVHEKVANLVQILSESDDANIQYPADKQYDFKPPEDAGSTEGTIQPKPIYSTALKAELGKLTDAEKLKVVRNKLVDIYQKVKERDVEYQKVKESFYDVKTKVENWYVELQTKKTKDETASNSSGVVQKLKSNIENLVEIKKLDEANKSKDGKKILTPEHIPEMLEYAEALIESGSVNQAIWIMEDIQTITSQPEIAEFSTKARQFIEKYPTPGSNLDEIKDLIDMI